MAVFIALLRGVNVGGTGLLAMKDLTVICGELGFEKVRTYIQSGNVVFKSSLGEKKVCSTFEKALAEHMGKPIGVMVRSAAEMKAVLEANPFPEQEAAKTLVVFFPGAPEKEWIAGAVAPDGEELRLGKRELYIHYPNGMGKSKLKLPTPVAEGTARNINTVGKLAVLAAAI